MKSPIRHVRKPALAGQFYPASREALKKQIRECLDSATAKPDDSVNALIVPHASYAYSGPVAAEAYKTVLGRKFEAVIVIGFLQRIPLNGIFVDTAEFYETPLGKISAHTALAEEIRKQNGRLQETVKGDFSENSIEAQLPFLQESIPNLKLVPIYMGMQTPENARMLSAAIAAAIKRKNVLVVASSDLSHYHPAREAVDMDQKLIALVEKSDTDALGRLTGSGELEACGIGPILTVLFLAKNLAWSRPVLLRYAHSGEITGDNSGVVGYAALKFTGGAPAIRSEAALSHSDKQKIVSYVRGVLENHFDPEKEKPVLDAASPILNENRGVFITLKKEGGLRGCIGQIIATRPVRENLSEMALAAAFDDPRFGPITKEELPKLDIHVSILTIPQPVKSYEDIRLGTDGIVVRSGYRAGVFLPEVATETGWNQKEFFEHCARDKAGIHPKDFGNLSLSTFQTDSFGE